MDGQEVRKNELTNKERHQAHDPTMPTMSLPCCVDDSETKTTMPSYTLHTPAGSFRAFKILIAAEYNGIDIDIPEFDVAKATSLSPTGKAPVLETPQGALFESNSIARYIAKLRRDTGLNGNGSVIEEAAVDMWCDFAVNKLELPACVWFYPVVGYMPFHKPA